jgi:hypothetical protein
MLNGAAENKQLQMQLHQNMMRLEGCKMLGTAQMLSWHYLNENHKLTIAPSN